MSFVLSTFWGYCETLLPTLVIHYTRNIHCIRFLNYIVLFLWIIPFTIFKILYLFSLRNHLCSPLTMSMTSLQCLFPTVHLVFARRDRPCHAFPPDSRLHPTIQRRAGFSGGFSRLQAKDPTNLEPPQFCNILN